MPRIDAHVHVFTKESAEFPRTTSDWLPPEREEPVEKLMELMEASNIDQAGLIQIGGNEIEQHNYLLRCLKDYPNRFLGIGLIPPDCKDTAEHMKRLTDGTGIIGFRLSKIGGPRDPFAPMDVRQFETWPIWEYAAENDLVIWLYCCARDAFQIPWILEELPHVRVVMNHMGVTPGKGKFSIDEYGRPKVEIAGYTIEKHTAWRLTPYENVCVKLSGQYAFSRAEYPYEDIASWSRTLLSRFGSDRLMWATDFPWIQVEPGYDRYAEIVRKNIPDISDRDYDAIMGNTAKKVLRYPDRE